MIKKSLVFITLFSVSAMLAKLEYNWKSHRFYHTGSSVAINQDDYHWYANVVLGEALLSSDFALIKSKEELEIFWFIVYGVLKLYRTAESECVIEDIQSIKLNRRFTNKLIAQLKDSRKHDNN